VKFILLPLLFFISFCFETVYGQNQSNAILSKEIRLKPYILDNQVISFQSFVQSKISESEIFDGRYFRLIRFDQILTKIQKNELLSAGVQIEYYIPYKSYLLSIPKIFDKARMAAMNPVNVIRISMENKLSGPILDDLKNNEWQEYQQVELLVQIYTSVNASLAISEIEKFGAVSPFGTLKSTYSIRTKAKNIRTIASLSQGKYMELTPGTTVPDDTKGRS